MPVFIVHPEADAEIADAAEYLEDHRAGYGYLFLDELQRAVDYLDQYPESMQFKFGQMREMRLKRFDYVVVYEIHQNEIHIYHVVHTSRHPDRRYNKNK